MGNRIGKDPFQVIAVAHHGSGQVGKVPLAKKGQRKGAQFFGQADPPLGAFSISRNIGTAVLNVMGQETYQVTGKAHEVAIDEELVIPDEDIEMVANQANVSEDEAKAALEDTNGDLAEAILKLNQ